MPESANTHTAVLGGGCFWCLEPIFESLRGVQRVTVGYAGGKLPNPSYEDVCSGETGHAEVVRVEYDAREISYETLLEVFFSVHDPTTPNRQGADIGTQYRSIILYADEAEHQKAQAVIEAVNGRGEWRRSLVTQLVPLDKFYPAEEYHQQYFKKNPWAGYCQVVIRPKVARFRQKFDLNLKQD